MPTKPSSVFQMSRPVISGSDALLSVTRHYCDQYITDDYEYAPFRPDRYAVFGKNADGLENSPEFQTAVGRKRYKVTSELKLPIARVVLPPMYRSFFHRAAGIIDSEKLPLNPEVRVWENIQKVDEKYGVDTPDQILVHADGLRVIDRPGTKERVLGLTLQPEELFVQEHDVVLTAMLALANKRIQDVVRPQINYRPLIPLALIEPDVPSVEVDNLVDEVQSELPIRLVLGELRPPMVS